MFFSSVLQGNGGGDRSALHWVLGLVSFLQCLSVLILLKLHQVEKEKVEIN